MENKFRKEFPDKQKRKEMSESLIKKNPGEIPVILEKEATCKLGDIKKTRYLFKENFTINEFLAQIRKSLKISRRSILKFVLFCFSVSILIIPLLFSSELLF